MITNTPLKFIVVGTGRCGTNLLQQMFNGTGINCGHENIFNSSVVNSVKQQYMSNTEYVAESSWVAVPYLDQPWIDDRIKIIHLIRDPISVIKSFWDIEFFRNERINKHRNKLVYRNTTISAKNQDRLVSSVDHYFQWNMLIKQKLEKIDNPSIVFHLENLKENIEPLNTFLGVDLAYTDERFNTKQDEKDKSTEFPVELAKEIIKTRYDGWPSFSER